MGGKQAYKKIARNIQSKIVTNSFDENVCVCIMTHICMQLKLKLKKFPSMIALNTMSNSTEANVFF